MPYLQDTNIKRSKKCMFDTSVRLYSTMQCVVHMFGMVWYVLYLAISVLFFVLYLQNS